MSPRGRRPAGADTRAEIVAAARAEFAERGYGATSLRGIARRAGVDPALIHHYFQGKQQLFAEVIAIPIDPEAIITGILATPRDRLGMTMARAFFTIWDSPDGKVRFLGLFRSAMTHDDAARMIREFLAAEIFGRVARAAGGQERTAREADLRGGLAAAQMIGMATLRYVVGYPAIVEASAEDLVAELGPTLQRYLVGDNLRGPDD
ncbi:MAG: TetR family transcriptional regulator [Tetrasphaera sp.]